MEKNFGSRSSAGHEPSAVNIKNHSRDVGSCVTGKKENWINAFAQIGHAVQGNRIKDFIAVLLAHGVKCSLESIGKE